MSIQFTTYQIVVPQRYTQSHEEIPHNGIIENVTIELDKGDRFKLLFIDFYRLTEEFTRSLTYYQRDWFSLPNMVVTTTINPESIQRSISTIIDEQIIDSFVPLQKQNEFRSIEAFSIKFPDWYEDTDIQAEVQDKGFLDEIILQTSDGRTYQLHFEDFVSFTQRFAANARIGEISIAEPGLVLVSKITPEIITNAIHWLIQQNYFAYLSPLK